MTDYSRLRAWTPIRLHARPEPQIEWADLSDPRAISTETTGLGALDALDRLPSLEPNVIIAHASRCGSTLLARLLAVEEGTVLLLEPQVLNDTLRYAMDAADPAATRLVRQMVRALGRIQLGHERRLVLKLTSTTTRALPLIRRAFPNAPIVWLQRRPIEIVASRIHRPGPQHAAEDTGTALARGILRQLTEVFLAASAYVTDDMTMIDYTDLPAAAWTTVARRMGLTLTEPQVLTMQAASTRDAKSGGAFERVPPRELPDWIGAAVRQTLDPLYEALDRRRQALTGCPLPPNG